MFTAGGLVEHFWESCISVKIVYVWFILVMATSATADAAIAASEVAKKIRKRISTLKGHFTRCESRIMNMKCRASEQVVATNRI